MRTRGASLLLVMCLGACGSVTSSPDAGDDDAGGQPDSGSTAPVLSSIDPPSGIVTTEVTLTGSDFGATQGGGTVSVGGVDASVVSWADGSIVAVVPFLPPGDADVTVTTAGGTSGALPFLVTLPPMVYLANDANEAASGFTTVTALAFDPATGALTETGAALPVGSATPNYGGCDSTVAVHQGTRRLFAVGTSTIAVFDIDPVTGALTQVTGSPFANGSPGSYQVVVNRAGTRIFVANYHTPGIAVYDVNAQGSLTAVSGSPFVTSIGVDTVALSGSEQFLYANSYGSQFLAYAVAASGSLSLVAGSPFSPGAYNIGTRPGQDQLFAVRNPSIHVWSLNPTTGVPIQITGSPFSAAPPAGELQALAFTSDGNRLYTSTLSSGYIFAHDLDAAGVPTLVAGAPFNFTASLSSISCLAVSRDDAYLLAVGEGQKKVAVFTLTAAGAPAQVAGSPFVQTTPAESAGGIALTF